MKFMAVYFFQNKQFVIVKKRPEFVITVKNDLFWNKICNFEIFQVKKNFETPRIDPPNALSGLIYKLFYNVIK